MATPLSPLSSNALNTKSPGPATPDVKASHTPIASPPAKSMEPVEEGDMTVWDDAPSSPFLADVAGQENRDVLSTPSKQRSPSKPQTSPLETSSSEALVEDVLELKPEEHGIQEEASEVPEEETATPKAAMKSLAKDFSAQNTPASTGSPLKRAQEYEEQPTLRDNEGLTIAVRNMEQQQIGRIETFVEEESVNEITLGGIDDQTNVDDTCFSTFSEIPNTDMTAFARIGARSPFRQAPMGQVRQLRLQRL